MPWYNTGTVAVTNNSATVTGTGTAWADNIDAGQAFIGPDGLAYEIAAVVSATSITLASAYKGATASGQAYRIMPVQGYLRDLATQAAALVLSFATVRDGIGQGIFPVGSVGTPGFRFSGDEDTGVFRGGTNVLGIAAAGGVAAMFDENGIQSAGGVAATPGFSFYGDADTGMFRVAANTLGFSTQGVERARLGSDGRLGIGTTSPAQMLHVVAANPRFRLEDSTNPKASSITVMEFSGSDGRLGFVGANVGDMTIYGENNVDLSFRTGAAERLRIMFTGGVVRPGVDNAQTLGQSSFRWSVVYAGTGAINTSDERAKQNIGGIPDEWLDAWGALEWVRYKFVDSIELKGDAARWHVGLIAQRVRDTFHAAGLDALAIGLLCYDEWEEEREPIMEERRTGTETVIVARVETGLFDAQGEHVFREVTEDRPIMAMVETGETRVTLEAGNRWGLRYDECQAMEAAWQRRELARKDALVAALTARLEALETA